MATQGKHNPFNRFGWSSGSKMQANAETHLLFNSFISVRFSQCNKCGLRDTHTNICHWIFNYLPRRSCSFGLSLVFAIIIIFLVCCSLTSAFYILIKRVKTSISINSSNLQSNLHSFTMYRLNSLTWKIWITKHHRPNHRMSLSKGRYMSHKITIHALTLETKQRKINLPFQLICSFIGIMQLAEY